MIRLCIFSLFLAMTASANPGTRYAVIGVISASDGVVVIKDKQSKRNLVLRDGDKLGSSGYKIVAVGRKEVTVERGSQKYVLVKDAFEQPSGGYARRDEPRRTSRRKSSNRKMPKPIKKRPAVMGEEFDEQVFSSRPEDYVEGLPDNAFIDESPEIAPMVE